jgi:DNA-binding beta-propeller fold protein YncE
MVSAGVLSLQSSVGGLSGPEGIVSDPTGSFVYVANSATGQVLAYTVGSAGALSLIAAYDTENPANPASAPAYLAITQ